MRKPQKKLNSEQMQKLLLNKMRPLEKLHSKKDKKKQKKEKENKKKKKD
jgi:hypothetical protein